MLVDLDWDAGGASGMRGYPRERQPRTPLVDTLRTGRTPSVVRQDRRPDLAPCHPHLAVNQPEPADLRDQLATWAVGWDRPWGSSTPTLVGEGGLRRTGRRLGDGHAHRVGHARTRRPARHPGRAGRLPRPGGPQQGPPSPPVPLLERLERILAAAGHVPQTDVISFYPWLARRQLRVALTGYDPPPHRVARLVDELRVVTKAVESYG